MENDPVELEKKLLANYQPLDSFPLTTINIALSPNLKSIPTREELTVVPPRNKDKPNAFNVGDLLWVKLSGFPYWPAMISRDPEEKGIFAKSSGDDFSYHVQYFGEATRNWIRPNKFWPFEGPILFLPTTKKSVIPKSKSKLYEQAIAIACQAYKLEPQIRVKKLTFNYILIDPTANHTTPSRASNSASKKKRITARAKIKLNSSNNESVYDFDESIDEIEQDDKPELVWSRPREPSPPMRDLTPPPRPLKRLRGSISLLKRENIDAPQLPATDTMTSSEDASSTSDLEAPDVRLDKLCNVCQSEEGNFYFCSGTCLRTMHAACGGSESTNNNNDNFICQECKTGKHPCFVCKSTEGDCVKCCHKNCGKYYHIACLDPQSYPSNIKSEKTFTCPMHYCLTCYTDHPYPRDINCLKPSKRQLMKCLNCPTAFHNDNACTAAGAVVLAGNYVMCPAHRSSSKSDKHINVSWCFSCNEGGKLICCESCPAAFHAECIDNPPKSDEQNYYCYDCQMRRQLHYGDVIWIKLGAYRWWPARIVHPNTVPENIMKLSHTSGDFPVYFFGSHDYYWSHRGRVFAYVEDDGQMKYNKTGTSDKKFKMAVEEARKEYALQMVKNNERLEKMKSLEKPKFRLIKQNKPINNVSQSTSDDIKMSAKPRCECKQDGNVLCGSDDCLNRIMMLECEPGTCPVGDKCKNQRFRKRQYPVCVPFRTEQVGWGLRTTQDIKKGDFVIEYVGELIDEAECNRRMELKMDKGDTTFYFLTIDKDRIIDAGPAANHARFMNHSCQPNCETQKWVVNGQTRVGLFAICDIPAGSELTFNYNLDCRGNEKMKCRCNSDNCSGYIGLPVKNAKKNNST